METPVTSCDDVELERRRRLIAARRRIIEQEVLKYLIGDDKSGISNSNNNHTYEELEDEDGYEEVMFDPTKAASEVAAALASSRSKSAERKRRSNSDSNLHAMDEYREVELCSTANTVLKITVEDAGDEDVADVDMTEQGFYRVYDDLEKIREFDLIPYVLERKKRAQEFKEITEKQEAEKGPTEKSSPDSGRASVVSSDLSEAATSANDLEKRKSSKSDTGSSCSADSGTYNLFPETSGAAPSGMSVAAAVAVRERSKSNDFLKRLSAQLSSVALRPSPPPMPPKGKATPPPLPPRTFGRRQRSPRRKDLASHLGLVTEAVAPSDRAAAHEVAMRNLPSQLVSDSGISPPGKKDLKRHLGVNEMTDMMPPAQSNLLKRLSPPKPSQLLVQLHLQQQRATGSTAKPKNFVKILSSTSQSTTEEDGSVKKSCRRELDFGEDFTTLTESSRSKSQAFGAPTPPLTPGSALKSLTSASGRNGGRSVASKIFFKRHNQTPRGQSSRSPSPYKLKSGGLTPVSGRKFKVKEARRSFMSSLLSSSKAKQISASADPIVALVDPGDVNTGKRTRDYSRTVREALRDGLPVIPFGSSSIDELTGGKASSVYLPMGTAGSQPAIRRGTWSPGSTTGLAAALVTPARGPRQHCQSCTCHGGGGGAASTKTTMATADLDYVRMETPKLRQKRRKSLSEIVTDPFLA